MSEPYPCLIHVGHEYFSAVKVSALSRLKTWSMIFYNCLIYTYLLQGLVAFSEHGLMIRWWSLGSVWWEKLNRNFVPVHCTKLIFVPPWEGFSPNSSRSSIMASIMGNDRQVNSQVFSLVLRGINFVDMNFEVDTTIYCYIYWLLAIVWCIQVREVRKIYIENVTCVSTTSVIRNACICESQRISGGKIRIC